jgi:hypothetical protein
MTLFIGQEGNGFQLDSKYLQQNTTHSQLCYMQVLQRKSEEAATATRRLKEVLEARKATKDHASHSGGFLSLFACLKVVNKYHFVWIPAWTRISERYTYALLVQQI